MGDDLIAPNLPFHSRERTEQRLREEIERLRAEVAKVKRLYADCDGCLGRTLARAETAELELAALRDRFEKAPDVILDELETGGVDLWDWQNRQSIRDCYGHRVRLVREG